MNFDEYRVVPSDGHHMCAGTREDCWGYVYDEPNASRQAFGKPIDEHTRVVLAPSIKKMLRCTNLDFISPQVTHLSVPLPLMSLVRKEKLPNLSCLAISMREEYFDHFEMEQCSLDAGLNLKALILGGDSDESGQFWKNTKINLSDYPDLEYASLFIEDVAEIEPLLHNPNLLHLTALVQDNTNQQLEVPPNLVSLVVSVGVDVQLHSPAEKSSKLQKLEFRDEELNTIDCLDLLEFLDLQEITFMGLKKSKTPWHY